MNLVVNVVVLDAETETALLSPKTTKFTTKFMSSRVKIVLCTPPPEFKLINALKEFWLRFRNFGCA